ncbi:MAG: lactate racemase domain-containing protein [Planctomycetota bacterium]
MSVTIEFGSQLKEIHTDRAPVPLMQPPVAPLQDVRQAVAEALEHPLGYPPLTDAILEGDRVTVAIGGGVPQLPAVLAGIIRTLSRASLDVSRVQVLLADERDQEEDLIADLPAEWKSITIQSHDPGNRDGLGYLAADKSGKPIYFGRAILDADFVIPVSVAYPAGSLGEFGIHGGLLPNFGDAATVKQFAAMPSSARESGTAAASEAGWLLGSRFTVQVVPASRGQIAQVFAGDIDAVEPACRDAVEEAWAAVTDQQPELVVACLGSDGSRHTWRQAARALDAATQIVSDTGTILICCELAGRLGPALRELATRRHEDDDVPSFTDDIFTETVWDDEDDESLEDESLEDEGLSHDPHAVEDEPGEFSHDLQLASVLRNALHDHRVYLYSALDEDDVASLGLIHVSNPHEIANLCQRHGSYLILPDAECVRPRLEVETTPQQPR